MNNFPSPLRAQQEQITSRNHLPLRFRQQINKQTHTHTREGCEAYSCRMERFVNQFPTSSPERMKIYCHLSWWDSSFYEKLNNSGLVSLRSCRRRGGENFSNQIKRPNYTELRFHTIKPESVPVTNFPHRVVKIGIICIEFLYNSGEQEKKSQIQLCISRERINYANVSRSASESCESRTSRI